MKHPEKDHVFKNEVEYFESFTEAIEVFKTKRKPRSSTFNNRWSGGMRDYAHVERMNRDGWKEGADAMTMAFDASALASLNTHGQVWKMDVAGFVPCVPSYLAGDPAHMRRKVPSRTSKAPITVVVDLISSGSISADTVQKRAIAVACLINYLTVFRAVNLYITAFLPGNTRDQNCYYFPMIPLGTTPIDLPMLAWQMCHIWPARGLLYGLGNFGEDGITWGTINKKTGINMTNEEYINNCKQCLDLLPDDIFIPGLRANDPTYNNPEAWAKDKLAAMGYTMDM